jgi:hypothetical protein
MKESSKNMNVPANSPRTMTRAFLTRSPMGLPTRRSTAACSVGKPVMPVSTREVNWTILADFQEVV